MAARKQRATTLKSPSVTSNKAVVPVAAAERAQQSIVLMRCQRVILDEALAELYGVPVKALNQAVKRNAERFPEDFMFRLTEAENALVRSQTVTLDAGGGRGQHRKYLPYAFTEQGVAMLSSVLRSPQAIAVNIEIMRTFVKLRRILQEHAELARQLEKLEKKYDAQFRVVFDAIRELMAPSPKQKGRIGFQQEGKP